MPMTSYTKDRLRLLLIATAVAVVAVPIIVSTVVLVPDLQHVNWKWVRFTIVTIFFVGYCLKSYWRARRHLRFWGILLVVLCVHFVGVGFFFYTGKGLPLMIFGPTVGLEFGLLALSVYHFLGIGPSGPRHQKDHDLPQTESRDAV